MPHSNTDAVNGIVASNLVRGAKVLDHTKAVEILESEHQGKDGLDVHTLIDSKRNGGLTYNDFLVLPGYIGTYSSLHSTRAVKSSQKIQASLRRP
jgi:IMP dehydrogenase